jgi:Ni2+-binding GTPase involved in maturation of urease and hydrogenase
MAMAAGFNRELALQNLERVSHHARIFELSAKIGDGMKAWLDFLAEQRAA